jgi:hypothetical protein
MGPVMYAAAMGNVLIVTAWDTQKRQMCAPHVTEQACVLIVRGQEKSENRQQSPLNNVHCNQISFFGSKKYLDKIRKFAMIGE